MKRLVIIVLVVVALALPQMAQAHGRLGGVCIAGILGFLLGGVAASHPSAPPPYPYYVPPSQCLREIPERWETRWDPTHNAYVRELIPRHFIRIPCR